MLTGNFAHPFADEKQRWKSHQETASTAPGHSVLPSQS